MEIMQRVWERFGQLPTWARVLGWIVAWPLLLALRVFVKAERTPVGALRSVAAAAILMFGGLFWWFAPFAAETDEASTVALSESADDRDREQDEPASARTLTPRTPAAPSESASPAAAAVATARPTPAATAPAGVPDGVQAAVVERIVDGDTLWVRVDEPGGSLPANASHQIRLLIIDTPETKHPSKPVECGGPEATEFAARMLPVGSTVHLLADQEDTDRYGRFLRYLWTADGTFFNVEAVRQGMGRVTVYQPNDRYEAQMRQAEAEAKANDRGMWGPPCDYDAPPPPPPAPEPKPEPAAPPPPAAESGGGDTYYRNCTHAREEGAAPLHRGDPGYRSGLDRDNDGVACE
jgi:micrococcal nuclease